MTGLEPPAHMKKKMFIESDLHLNSSVVIAEDEKNRHKTDYMKRYQQNQTEARIKIEAESAAGVKTVVHRRP